VFYCCECRVPLAKTKARYCPNGHPQFEQAEGSSFTSNTTPSIASKNQDRHSDNEDDCKVISPANFKPNLRAALSISAINDARSKAIDRDANRKMEDRSKG